jgi:hypothetical protein
MPAGVAQIAGAGTADSPGENKDDVFGTKTPDSVGVGPRGAEAEQPAAHKRKATGPPSKGRFKIVAQVRQATSARLLLPRCAPILAPRHPTPVSNAALG